MDPLNVIETPENVELEQPLAGIGSRFLAGLLDHLIIVALFAVLAFVAALAFFHTFAFLSDPVGVIGVWLLAVIAIVYFVIYWGYFVIFELWTNGQSPGKRALKVRVVKQSGQPIAFIDVAIRNILRAVDWIGGYAVGGICMFIGRRLQRLGDLAAGTVVVSEEVRDYSARSDKPVKAQWDQEATAELLRSTGLTPLEYRLLHSYWMRSLQLTPEARLRVLPRVLAPVLARTGQTLPDMSLATMEAFVRDLMIKARDRSGISDVGEDGVRYRSGG